MSALSLGVPRRSVAEALARIPTGAHLVCAPGMGAPTTMLAALPACSVGRRWRLSSGLLLDDYPFLPAVLAGDLAYRTWHVMGPVRDHVASGAVGYIPARASHIAHLLQTWDVGAALVRVSPPNAQGYCSLGASASYGMAAIRAASMAIAEVDPAVPRTSGDSLVHVSVFDSLVESTTPIPQYVSAPSTEVATTIAGHLRGLLPPNPTLQIGVGAIPETLVRSLADGQSDLGTVRFVGMATDDMVDLFGAGVLRADHVGPEPAILSPDMMATERLLMFADANPAIGMYPSSLAHDAAQLGRIERFVSINTAIEVDIMGNVNSEVLGGKQVSGPGGGLDYIDTATRSPGGRRIIALPAANASGAISRIVASVASVTIPRSMVDVIITEYGVAELAGRSLRERARALAEIAHPDHRDHLRESR